MTPACLERAFLQSVMYASVFDYPVTLRQLRHSLIGVPATEAQLADLFRSSPGLQAAIDHADGLYFPRGRRDLLAVRAAREAASRALLHRLRGPLRLVTHMPFVRMAAISGSLAHLNADPRADLDLFVITAPGRVWSVTVTALLVARLLGWRRHLCLNFVVSERGLMVGPADLFSANQIIHLQPVTGADAYRRFLAANRFVDRFYPNATRPKVADRPRRVRGLVEPLLDWTVAPAYEHLCRLIYTLHLRRRAHTWRSRDQVRLEPECLKLHTSSHRREVMERFERAVDEAGAVADAALATGSGADLVTAWSAASTGSPQARRA